MDSTAARRQRRREFVDSFLADIGLTHDVLAPATQRHLDDWARQVQLVRDQPSANWDNAVLQLCKAVESELACNLGRVKGLEFLASGEPLGTKAKRVDDFHWEFATKSLALPGLKRGFVPSTLPKLLLNLVRLRNESAHGGVAMRTAAEREGRQTRKLAAQILKEIILAGKERS